MYMLVVLLCTETKVSTGEQYEHDTGIGRYVDANRWYSMQLTDITVFMHVDRPFDEQM